MKITIKVLQFFPLSSERSAPMSRYVSLAYHHHATLNEDAKEDQSEDFAYKK